MISKIDQFGDGRAGILFFEVGKRVAFKICLIDVADNFFYKLFLLLLRVALHKQQIVADDGNYLIVDYALGYFFYLGVGGVESKSVGSNNLLAFEESFFLIYCKNSAMECPRIWIDYT